jgi:hypothetical protein
MRRGILIIILLAATTTGISMAQNATPADQSQELADQDTSSGILLTVKPSENEFNYVDLIKTVRDQYSEDLGCSSDILNEFVKSNITNREAMVATISVLALTTQTHDMFDQFESPEEYVKYQFYMQNALKYLKEYLWNMAKFYETGSNEYAGQARDYFNLSIYYYEKSIEEYELIQLSAVGK